jgi:hypothetical protein
MSAPDLSTHKYALGSELHEAIRIRCLGECFRLPTAIWWGLLTTSGTSGPSHLVFPRPQNPRQFSLSLSADRFHKRYLYPLHRLRISYAAFFSPLNFHFHAYSYLNLDYNMGFCIYIVNPTWVGGKNFPLIACCPLLPIEVQQSGDVSGVRIDDQRGIQGQTCLESIAKIGYVHRPRIVIM